VISCQPVPAQSRNFLDDQTAESHQFSLVNSAPKRIDQSVMINAIPSGNALDSNAIFDERIISNAVRRDKPA
jgi:hypothetical protein